MSKPKNNLNSYACHAGYGLVARSERSGGLKEIWVSVAPYAVASIILAIILFYMPL
jgi:hypothetical protein